MKTGLGKWEQKNLIEIEPLRLLEIIAFEKYQFDVYEIVIRHKFCDRTQHLRIGQKLPATKSVWSRLCVKTTIEILNKSYFQMIVSFVR